MFHCETLLFVIEAGSDNLSWRTFGGWLRTAEGRWGQERFLGDFLILQTFCKIWLISNLADDHGRGTAPLWTGVRESLSLTPPPGDGEFADSG